MLKTPDGIHGGLKGAVCAGFLVTRVADYHYGTRPRKSVSSGSSDGRRLGLAKEDGL